jgi:hypothetical protein
LKGVTRDEEGGVRALTDLACTDPQTPWLHGRELTAPLFAFVGEALEPEEKIVAIDRLSFSKPVYSNLQLQARRTPLGQSAGPVSAQFQTTKGETIFVGSSQDQAPMKATQPTSRHPVLSRIQPYPRSVARYENALIFEHPQDPVHPTLRSDSIPAHFHLQLWYQSFVHTGVSAVSDRFDHHKPMMVRSVEGLVVPDIEGIKTRWAFLSALVGERFTRGGFYSATAGIDCLQEGVGSIGRAYVTYVAVPSDYR